MPRQRDKHASQIQQRLSALSQNHERGSGSVRSETTAAGSAELYLYGIVGGGGWFSDGFTAEDVVAALKDLDVENLTVRLHSPGGDAWDGVAIMNVLRAHKANVHIVVDGIAASAASVIAMAGDTVTMPPGSQMMVHDAWILTLGNEAELLDDAAWVGKQSANIAGIYAQHAGGTPEQWREVMRAETWYTAEEAVEAGLADRVAAASDPVDATAQAQASTAWDLSLFNYAGRDAAPAPAAHTRGPKPPTESSGGSITTTQEGSPAVAFSDEQLTQMRQELGLPEDADEATISAALTEALAERAEAPSSSTTTTTVPEGMTLVEADVLQSLRDQAGQGAAARQQQLDEHRDRTINQAIADGKITPARKDHWVSSWTADPAGAEETLKALAPGLVPVEERGHDQQSTVAASAYDELYTTEQKGA